MTVTTEPTYLLENPSFYRVRYQDPCLIVYVGIQVRRDTNRVYEPVRQLLAELGAVLIGSKRVADRNMIGRWADLLVYDVKS